MPRGRDAPPAPKPPPVFVQTSGLQSRPDDARSCRGAGRGRRQLGRRHLSASVMRAWRVWTGTCRMCGVRRAVSATGGCSSRQRSPRDRAARRL